MSVSPKPDQPLVAAVVELKGLEGKMVRIYNYKMKELKQEFEFKGTGYDVITIHKRVYMMYYFAFIRKDK